MENTKLTQFTQYMWVASSESYFGEFNNFTQEFTVWRLCGTDPKDWILVPDISAPPKEILGSNNCVTTIQK